MRTRESLRMARRQVAAGLALSAALVMAGCGAPGTAGAAGDGTPDPSGGSTPTVPGGGTPNRPLGPTVSYAARIQPIFTAQCAGCHSPGGAADLAGIPLQLTADVSYDLLVNQPSVQRNELTLVAPGDAQASLLLLKVNSNTPPVGQRMPLFAPPLSEVEINLIQRWIDQGALNN